MIIKINGVCIDSFSPQYKFELKPFLPKSRKESQKIKKLATWLWGISGVFLMKSHVLAAETGSMWIKMQPLWNTFQDISMILGGISLFCGLIVYMFKRNLGKTVITTSILVVGGCFLVPSVLMLVAIIFSMLNDILMDVFKEMNLKDSVKVG